MGLRSGFTSSLQDEGFLLVIFPGFHPGLFSFGPSGTLVAIGLEACAAVGEFPTAGDDDHPDEVQSRDNPRGDKGGHEAGIFESEEIEGGAGDDDLEGRETESEGEFGPAPQAGALFLADTGDDNGELQEYEENPTHGAFTS